jgi:glycosyltransferase involved in cell wall biosynthesis
MTKPENVSVLMAFFNEGPDLLQKSIESVLAEDDYLNQLILINDASANTPALEQVIPKAHPKIRYLKNTGNLGLTKSLNIGLKEVNSPYVARLDSNDENINERLKKQVQFLEAHPDYGFCGSFYRETWQGEHQEVKVLWVEKYHDIVNAFAQFNPFAHSSLMFRTSYLKQLNGYNEFFTYTQDYDLTRRLLKVTKGENLSEELILRHNGPSSLSYKKYKQQLFYSWLTRVHYLFDSFNFSGLGSILKSTLILLTPLFIIKRLRS